MSGQKCETNGDVVGCHRREQRQQLTAAKEAAAAAAPQPPNGRTKQDEQRRLVRESTNTRVQYPNGMTREEVVVDVFVRIADVWKAQMFTVLDGLDARDPLLVSLWTAIFNAMTGNRHVTEDKTIAATGGAQMWVPDDISSSKCTSPSSANDNLRQEHSYKCVDEDLATQSSLSSSSSSPAAASSCSRRSSASTAASKSVSFDDDVVYFNYDISSSSPA
ncbi:hypothetical protein FOL47_001063 [Perkinsus chesapeaki]|uniref:Uncharacterized protein n=1 Tax=Perkinsus chesapeaki TaxID=330153 RepID=A0A7J6MKK3_PERCH|nr:hypothetical protein FOL47_001063 [Perkinsus chesapeaki]